ncbi:MAG: hypothetical protein AAB221_02025, partial [Bacteroidota bacterium]
TTRQKNLCEYGGIFGVLLSLTCLVQHIAVAIPGKVTNPMIPGYVFAIAAFTLLGLQKTYAIIFLIISGCSAAFTEYQWMKHYSFSLVVLLLFIYHVIIIVTLYVEEVPERLKQKRYAEKEEEDLWKGKI